MFIRSSKMAVVLTSTQNQHESELAMLAWLQFMLLLFLLLLCHHGRSYFLWSWSYDCLNSYLKMPDSSKSLRSRNDQFMTSRMSVIICIHFECKDRVSTSSRLTSAYPEPELFELAKLTMISFSFCQKWHFVHSVLVYLCQIFNTSNSQIGVHAP